VLRYQRHYFMANGINAQAVADEFLQHANEEQAHADQIAARIVQLGGAPNLSPEGMLSRSHSEYVEGESLLDMIREDLVAERVAIDSYKEMIQYFGTKDPTTRRMIEGILAVEMFLLRGGDLLVNELAPRPHNSFHETEVGCATSQFEQLVRAICDLPLGDPSVLRPAAIVNLFGDLWVGGQAPDFAAALARPGVRLHLYGKRGPRAGRKMGHLSAVADTPEDALDRVRAAAAAIVGGRSS
jgi:bacterioferritin (cytochrome b1)